MNFATFSYQAQLHRTDPFNWSTTAVRCGQETPRISLRWTNKKIDAVQILLAGSVRGTQRNGKRIPRYIVSSVNATIIYDCYQNNAPISSVRFMMVWGNKVLHLTPYKTENWGAGVYMKVYPLILTERLVLTKPLANVATRDETKEKRQTRPDRRLRSFIFENGISSLICYGGW